jgi:hypothetical protein
MSAPAPPVVMLLAVLLLTKVTFTAEVKALALIVPTPATSELSILLMPAV